MITHRPPTVKARACRTVRRALSLRHNMNIVTAMWKTSTTMAMTDMTNSVSPLLNLRILVLTLGESHHAGWWKSQFLSHTGLSFLEHVYPRSTFAAAVRSAGRAARAMHDANVGKGDVFHLFRLPREMERQVDTTLTEHSQALQTQYHPLLEDCAQLLRALEVLAGDAPARSSVGPMRLSAKPGQWAPSIAAAYWQAFRDGTQVFPYFEVEKTNL